MKKIFSVFCAVMLVFSLAACSGGSYTPELPENEYKAACKAVSYEDLWRYPDLYQNQFIRVSGKITKITESGSQYVVWVSTSNSLLNQDKIYVTYTRPATKPRLMKGDSIVIYGKGMGLKTESSVLGEEKIPQIAAGYIDIEQSNGQAGA